MVNLSCKTESSVITCKAHRDDIQPAKLQTFRYRELELATSGFSLDSLLGKGSYGWVYKGVLQDGKPVAVKRSSLARRNLHLQDENPNNPLDNELEILSKIRSTRLVNLIGYSRDAKETLLVVDYMSNGTLHDVLHSTKHPPLSWSVRVHVALQIAKGLRALHTATPPVIHRDIKSSNVLLDGDWNARLADFGLALRGRIEDVIRLSTPPAGTMGYLDPGYVSPGNLSTKTDVFSFGILLLEIMSGRNAIDVQYYPPNIVDWALPLIKQGRGAAICDPKSKQPANGEALNELALVAARCVRVTSARRPSMVEVVKELREISRRIQVPIWSSIVKPIKSSLDQLVAGEGMGLSLSLNERVMGRERKMKSAAGGEGGERLMVVSSSGEQSCRTRRARVRMIYAEDKLEVNEKSRRSSDKLEVNEKSRRSSDREDQRKHRSLKMADFLTR